MQNAPKQSLSVVADRCFSFFEILKSTKCPTGIFEQSGNFNFPVAEEDVWPRMAKGIGNTTKKHGRLY